METEMKGRAHPRQRERVRRAGHPGLLSLLTGCSNWNLSGREFEMLSGDWARRSLTERPRSYSAPRTRVWWNRENHRGAFTRLS